MGSFLKRKAAHECFIWMIMEAGWIKIHHKFLDWEWYQESGMVSIFINLLLRANYQPRRWRGMVIERGQLVTGRKQLSIETGLSEQTIRTCLQRLEQTGEIKRQPTNKYSIITICNYESYQCEENKTNQQVTNNQPTTNQQSTTAKEYKKERIYKKESSTIVEPKKSFSLTPAENLQKRKNKFYNSLVPFVETYKKEMIRAFFDYWTEPNKSETKMRFELERTWDVKRRLFTWASRDNKFNTYKNETDKRRGFEVTATSSEDYKTKF